MFFYLSWTDSRFKNEVLAATNASLNDPNYNNGQVLLPEHSRLKAGTAEDASGPGAGISLRKPFQGNGSKQL